MANARFQPFCRANNINLGCFDGIRVFLRIVFERNRAIFLHNNHFCPMWKLQAVSFNKSIEELERNFEIVDNYITEENVNSHFKYEFIPNKKQSHATIYIVYDIERQNTDRARLYNITFHLLSKLAAKYNRGLTPYEKEIT